MMASRILVVDDEQDVLNLVVANLKNAGFKTIMSGDGGQAINKASAEMPDLMVLDLMLPGVSGLEVCRAVKSDPQIARMPIIMLTAKAEEIDRVVGLELGADDYITKPFSPRELVLRVQAVLRRTAGWQASKAPSSSPNQQPGPIVAGNIKIDRNLCEVRLNGKPIQLSPIEYRLLVLLVESPDQVHSREKLLREVWGYTDDVQTRTVDTYVLRLREKLGMEGVSLMTVRGFGYRISSASLPGSSRAN